MAHGVLCGKSVWQLPHGKAPVVCSRHLFLACLGTWCTQRLCVSACMQGQSSVLQLPSLWQGILRYSPEPSLALQLDTACMIACR